MVTFEILSECCPLIHGCEVRELKRFMKQLFEVALSLKAASWLLSAQVVLLLAGAFQMPGMKAYSSINSVPLLEWMRSAPASATWWLWASVIVLALLALNTCFCSIDALIRKRHGRHWLLVASPQVIHIGFMLMLLAHLIDASGGFKANVMARQGQQFTLPAGEGMRIERIYNELSPKGMPLDYFADAKFFARDGKLAKEHRIAPNKPAFFKGMGFYVKHIHGDAAHIEVTRVPGAPWALAGGVLFTIGTVALMGLKIRRER